MADEILDFKADEITFTNPETTDDFPEQLLGSEDHPEGDGGQPLDGGSNTSEGDGSDLNGSSQGGNAGEGESGKGGDKGLDSDAGQDASGGQGNEPLSTESPTSDSGEQGAARNGSTSAKAPADDNFSQLLTEKSGGQFKTYQDVTDAIEKLTGNQKTDQDELDNDLIQKYKEFRTGRTDDPKSTAKLFLETQLQDFEQMDAKAVLRYKMKLDNPGRSDEDIDFLLNHRYKLDEEEFNEQEIRLAKLQLDDDALQARKELKTMQEKVALKEAQSNQDQAEQAEKIKQENERWENDVRETLKDFDKIELTVNEKGDQFTFGVEQKKDLEKLMTNLPGFWERYINADKSENLEKLRYDMTVLLNLDKIIKSVYDNGVSKGRDEILNERKNPSDNPQGNPDGGDDGKSELQIAAEGLAAQLHK